MARERTEGYVTTYSATRSVGGWLPRPVEGRIVVALCILALVRGLLYVAIIPPWEHYDEPTHFEYAALIARSNHIPATADNDPALRVAIARSMQSYSTWGITGVPETVPAPGRELPSIGVPQVGHLPAYYLLASLPLRLTASMPVEVQLYAVRTLSVLLMVLLVALTAWLFRLVAPGNPSLRLAALSVVVCTPSYGALMAAVSNDVLTSFGGLLLVLLGVAVVRLGWSWRAAALALAGLALPFLIKRTIFTMALVPLLALAMILPPPARRWLWRGAAVACAIGVAWVLLGPWGSGYWVATDGGRLAPAIAPLAQHGSLAIQLSEADHDSVGQQLSGQAVFALRGHQATSGVWARALHGRTQVIPPQVYGAQPAGSPAPVVLDEQWRFISSIAKVPGDAEYLELLLAAPTGEGTVLYDNAIVAQGAFVDVPPPATNADGTLHWGEHAAVNWLRNPSMEEQVPALTLSSSLMNAVNRTLPMGSIDLALSSLRDVGFLQTIYPSFIPWIIETFWLTTGRGLMVSPPIWNQLLLLITGLSLLGWIWRGALALATRSWQSAPMRRLSGWWGTSEGLHWPSLTILAAAAIVAWGTAILRVHLQPPDPAPLPYLPVGRYAFAGFVPTALLLAIGIQWLLPKRLRPAAWVALPLIWVALDVCAIGTNLWYYYAVR